MLSRFEYLNRAAGLGRLRHHQLAEVGQRLNEYVTRRLARKRLYAYVVVTIPLDANGLPLPASYTWQSAKYEAKNEDAVYFAGQSEFKTQNTSEQLMVDTVIHLEG
jgi:hypothetical protein